MSCAHGSIRREALHCRLNRLKRQPLTGPLSIMLGRSRNARTIKQAGGETKDIDNHTRQTRTVSTDTEATNTIVIKEILYPQEVVPLGHSLAPQDQWFILLLRRHAV